MARKIPASLIKEYNRAIKRQGGASERAVKSALTEYIAENPEATVEELREYAIELLKSAGELYGNACSQAAFDLQDEIAREFGAKPPDTGGWYYEPDAESIEKTVHYHAGKLVDGDVSGFVREMGSAARFYAERGANATMVETAKKQDRKNRRSKRTGARTHGVTFARVPQGTTTCDFCIMLASRGFVYLTEESAGEFDRFHKNCDCRIVPGYPGIELEGYDPDLYYDMWKNPEKYENRSDETTDTQPLRMTGKETYSHYASDVERIRDWMRAVTIVDQKEYSGPNISNKTRADRQTEDDIKILEPLLRQAEDRKLIAYGKRIDHFVNEPSEGRDLFVHAALIRDKRHVEVREEIQQDKRKNIDTRINGELVDIKCPISDGSSKNPLGFVKDNFYTAVEQFKKDPDADEHELRLLYCTRYTTVDDDAIIRELERFAAKDYVASIEVLKKNGEFHTVK